jgi:nitroreductase
MNKLSVLQEIIENSRSYRKFYADEAISTDLLRSWINLARLSPSARNMQSLKYIIVNKPSENDKIFPLLTWAGYLEDWDGPSVEERPSAYIVVLNDNSLSNNYFCDDGIMSQSILLGATASGFGGCMIAAVKKKELRDLLNIDEQYKIIHVIALGKPKEDVQIDDIIDNDIKYWRDSENIHHVPKRTLDELILK